jgi:drug/metabolite transporter (DMT)-like permease
MPNPAAMQKTSLWLPLALLLSLGFIWGTGYSLARFATTNGVPPLGYSFWQSLGPAFLISVLYWVRKRMTGVVPEKTGPQEQSSAWAYYFIYGLTGIALPNTLMYYASPHLPAGILAMIVNTVPIFAYLMAFVAGLERFHGLRLLGVFFACLGLMCLLLPSTSLPPSTTLPWVVLALLTPLSFAFCSVYIACTPPRKKHPLALAAHTLVASSLLLAPLVFYTGNFYSFHFPLTLADDVILLEILLSSLGYVLFFQLLKIAGPVYYSMVDTIVVLTGLLWGYLIFGETLNLWTGLALACILLALFFVTKTQRAA